MAVKLYKFGPLTGIVPNVTTVDAPGANVGPAQFTVGCGTPFTVQSIVTVFNGDPPAFVNSN